MIFARFIFLRMKEKSEEGRKMIVQSALNVVFRLILTFLEDSVAIVYGLRGLESIENYWLKAPKPIKNGHRIV